MGNIVTTFLVGTGIIISLIAVCLLSLPQARSLLLRRGGDGHHLRRTDVRFVGKLFFCSAILIFLSIFLGTIVVPAILAVIGLLILSSSAYTISMIPFSSWAD